MTLSDNRIAKYWSGKAVLVTGASSGIGWALVEKLAPFGVRFCLLSRRLDRMEELARQQSDSGSSFWLRKCDVRNRLEIYEAIDTFVQEMGGLDIAWVNSGISISSAHADWNWQHIEDMIDTNLKGAIYTAQACMEVMTKQGHGTVVGIGSASAMRGLPGRGVYSLTKVGLEYFLMSKAVELPQLHIAIVHPGWVDTPINAGNKSRFWLLTPEQAASIMLAAIARRRRFFVYPGKMSILFHLIRWLPYPLYLWLAARTMNLSKPSKR